MTRTKKSLFVLAASILALVVIEGAARLLYGVATTEERRLHVERTLGIRDANLHHAVRYRPHPYMNFVLNPDYRTEDGQSPHHSIGIRATDVPLFERSRDALRIVGIGASTTFGMYAPDGSEVWCQLLADSLQEELGIPVEMINAGVPYYSTFEMVSMAAIWLPELRPDIVLIHAGMNDAFTVGFADEGGPDNTAFRKAWSYRPPPAALSGLMRGSVAIRLLGMSWLERNGYAMGDITAALQHELPAPDALERNVAAATGRYYRRNLETLVALARHSGAEPILLDMPLNPEKETGLGPYYDAVSAAVVRNNEIMREIGHREGLIVVDLYGQMRDSRAFLDVVHLKRPGMEQKSWLVGNAILPRARSLADSRLLTRSADASEANP